MKKLLFVILVVALLMSFTACSFGSGIPQETEKTLYDKLNEFAEQTYREIVLEVTAITGDVVLYARYTLTAETVTYSIDRLNMLPTDGNLDGATPEWKTTVTGTATVENGTVKTLDGEAVELPSYEELKGTFTFKQEYFQNIETKSGSFSADVSSVAEFLGTEASISNVKIEVEYATQALKRITLTYQTEHSTVTTVYEFTK